MTCSETFEIIMKVIASVVVALILIDLWKNRP